MWIAAPGVKPLPDTSVSVVGGPDLGDTVTELWLKQRAVSKKATIVAAKISLAAARIKLPLPRGRPSMLARILPSQPLALVVSNSSRGLGIAARAGQLRH